MGKQKLSTAQRLRDAEREWDNAPKKKWRKKPAKKRTLLLDNIVRTDTVSQKPILQLDLFDPLNITAHG